MTLVIATAPYFTSELAAFDYMETVRWPQTPSCPHCGRLGKPYDLQRTRIGLKKCRVCYRQFTVRIGTYFESTHIPTHKWLQIIFLLRGCNAAVGPTMLRKIVGLSYRTAWRVANQIRSVSEQPVHRVLASDLQGAQRELFVRAAAQLADEGSESRFHMAVSYYLRASNRREADVGVAVQQPYSEVVID
ncbi:MAG: hypothetical protein GC190_06820 [Alphaproteobacteria bacterium]|nr:hypothetical protein [Alphaproteobacteria bacterium]